jgi:hypothetical protein
MLARFEKEASLWMEGRRLRTDIKKEGCRVLNSMSKRLVTVELSNSPMVKKCLDFAHRKYSFVVARGITKPGQFR